MSSNIVLSVATWAYVCFRLSKDASIPLHYSLYQYLWYFPCLFLEILAGNHAFHIRITQTLLCGLMHWWQQRSIVTCKSLALSFISNSIYLLDRLTNLTFNDLAAELTFHQGLKSNRFGDLFWLVQNSRPDDCQSLHLFWHQHWLQNMPESGMHV